MTAPSVLESSVAGWGRYPVQPSRLYRPEYRGDAVVAAELETSLLARGLGRSYGDQALNEGGALLDMTRLGRLLAFDAQTGDVYCEAGTSLSDLIAVFLPRGFLLPVTPGTRFVTVGGAIANDVHGKNHHQVGSFGNFVRRLTLWTPARGVVTCSPTEDAELFWATVGGQGLTGVILDAVVQLVPVESAYLWVDYQRTSHLAETLERFEAEDQGYQYSVAWIDVLASGRSLGRSVLMRANPAKEAPLVAPRRRRLDVPFDAPGGLLNRMSIQAFNTAFYHKHPRQARQLVDFERYFYPLDALAHWNRLYGKRGFLQYQATVPLAAGRAGVEALLNRLSGMPAFLAVLKRFGPAGRGLLSHPLEGYTLALDLPFSPGLPDFLRGLDQVLLAHGGRVYLAKDAVTTAASFARMYPNVERFRAIAAGVDPAGCLTSSQARRLAIRG